MEVVSTSFELVLLHRAVNVKLPSFPKIRTKDFQLRFCEGSKYVDDVGQEIEIYEHCHDSCYVDGARVFLNRFFYNFDFSDFGHSSIADVAVMKKTIKKYSLEKDYQANDLEKFGKLISFQEYTYIDFFKSSLQLCSELKISFANSGFVYSSEKHVSAVNIIGTDSYVLFSIVRQ